MNPRVSAVIPTHNRADFVQSAIQSVLDQTFQDFEIIVVDDGSRDNTSEVVKKFADPRIQFHRNETSLQVAEARNVGLRHAKGEYVAFLDDDDEWMREKLARQLAVAQRTGAPAIYTGFSRVDIESGEELASNHTVADGDLIKELRTRNVIGTASTVMIKRSCFEDVGMFDTSIPFGEEYDMWIRIAAKYPFVGIPESLVRYSVHPASLSRNPVMKIAGLKRQLEKHAALFAQDPPNLSRRYRTLAVLYLDVHQPQNARVAIGEALKADPGSLRNYFYWLVCHLQGAAPEARIETEERDGTTYTRRVLRALGSRAPWLRDAYRTVGGEARAFRYVVRNGLWTVLKRRKAMSRRRQAPLKWTGRLTFLPKESVPDALARHGLKFSEGGHAVYVRPQEGLSEKLGSFVSFYPPDTGFKILKNLKGPSEARYLGDARANAWAQAAVVGTAQDLVTAANYLSEAGIGPRVHDVAEVSAGDLAYTMFAMEHVDGVEPTEPECRSFLRLVHRLIDENRITIASPDWQKQEDFRCPSCSGNLLKSKRDGSLKYVDFQNFVVRDVDEWVSTLVAAAKHDVHFGNEYLLRGGRYLYQRVPGVGSPARRDSEMRWKTISDLMREAGAGVEGRLVLDVGCNLGMMLGEALSDGALWGIGWDRPNVVQHGRKLLAALGYTRFTLNAAELSSDYPLDEDVPEPLRSRLPEATILYLSIRHHIGFLNRLGTMPWKTLVYEGAQGELGRDFDRIAKDLKTVVDCELIARRDASDGDSDARPLAIFRRS